MRNSTNWSLRRRATVLCVLVGLLLSGLAAVGLYVAAENRRHLDTLLTKTGPLRTDAEALLAALVNQETGVRGFAVSGNDADLTPYRTGMRQERELVVRMGNLLRDHPEIRRQLDAVIAEAQRWRTTVAEPVIAVAGQDPQAAQALLTDDAREQFERMRTSVDVLQAEVLTLRNEVAGEARSTGNELVILLVVAAVVVIVAGFSLVSSLNRFIIGPVTTLAAQARDVAAGDYGRKIREVGPPELARLAGDIDAMRQKIADDLAEVRAARAAIERVNSQLEKQAEELVRSNRDLEQFAYVASHDLQEPLRKVASFCQLLQRRYAGQLDERADQYIAFAVDGAQRMQRLINDLLAFSRIGRLTSGFTDVDLDRVMGDVASQTEAARQYAGGELTWSGLPTIRGEEPLLTNLLVNLVSNSLKFRRPDVPPKVQISARRVDDEWEVTCRDNGIGIEPEFADKIFVIFQRLHSKDAYPGTGIGLAIVKKIVEYHGGRIWVDSEVDEGASISFTLPAAAEPELATGPVGQPADDAATPTDDAAPDGEAADRAAPGTDSGTAAAGARRNDPAGEPVPRQDGMRENVS